MKATSLKQINDANSFLIIIHSLNIRYQPDEIEHKQLNTETDTRELSNLSARSSLSDGKQLIDELVIGKEETKTFSKQLREYVSSDFYKKFESLIPGCVSLMIILVFGICLLIPRIAQVCY